MRRYVAREHGNPPVLHLCEIEDDYRIGRPVCGLEKCVTITYPSGATDCKTCHDIVADRGRNRQVRAFDLSDEDDS